MATFPPRNQEQHFEQIQSDNVNRQNADAYEGPTSPSNVSDSKRSHAAQLAQELASQSSWSEAFIPQNHSETFSSGPSFDRASMPGASQPPLQESDSHTAMTQHDLDPPPAYSNVPPVHELPATPLMTRPALDTTEQDRAIDIENRENSQDEEPDVEAPLLGRQPAYQEARRCVSWWWQRREKAAKRRRFKKLCCLMVTFVVAVIVIVALITGSDHNSWSGDPSEPSQTLVPTGPVYQRFETIKSITGAYKLYERLELATTTGIIDIEIDPQPGDSPAFLLLSSDLGSITVRVSKDYRRRRNRARRTIHTEIRSLTGSVVADILLGNGGAALIDTTTGNQMVSVLTYDVGSHDDVSNLTTFSETGAQKLVLNSLESAYKYITNVRAEHHGFATAALDIDYPSNWLGEIRAHVSPLGLVDVQGDDLDFTKTGHREIIAHRGSSEDMQRVEVISDGTGTASFKC